MSRQPSCCGMCKIVTWSGHYLAFIHNTILQNQDYQLTKPKWDVPPVSLWETPATLTNLETVTDGQILIDSPQNLGLFCRQTEWLCNHIDYHKWYISHWFIQVYRGWYQVVGGDSMMLELMFRQHLKWDRDPIWLTHLPLVLPIFVDEPDQHWFR